MKLRYVMRVVRLFVALIVGGLFSLKTPKVALRRFWNAFTLWKVIFVSRDDLVDFWTAYRRYRTCKKCPVFYAPLRTCGSPFLEYPNLGCWCQEEWKVRLLEATCFLDDTLGDAAHWGWQKSHREYSIPVLADTKVIQD